MQRAKVYHTLGNTALKLPGLFKMLVSDNRDFVQPHWPFCLIFVSLIAVTVALLTDGGERQWHTRADTVPFCAGLPGMFLCQSFMSKMLCE